MAADSPDAESGSRIAGPGVPARGDHLDPPALESTLVRYADSPNRRTVYPPGLSTVTRMSTWLTADDAAFYSLSEMR